MDTIEAVMTYWFGLCATGTFAWIAAAEVTRYRARRKARRDADMRRHPSAQAADEHTEYAARLIAELEADLIIAARENRK